MGTFSIWHWIIVGIVVLLLFGGRGKLSSLMGDAAKGITAFRKGLKEGAEEENKPEEQPKQVETGQAAASVDASRKDSAAKG